MSGFSNASGSTVTHQLEVDYNTPGLTTGAVIFTPRAGDVLLNLWVEIVTAWNGTTPKGDVGTFGSTNLGYYQQWSQANDSIDMTKADTVSTIFSGASWGQPGIPMWDAIANPVAGSIGVGLHLSATAPAAVTLKAAPAVSIAERNVPTRFRTAQPILFVVSQTGQKSGADPVATQGKAFVFLVTCTPQSN